MDSHAHKVVRAVERVIGDGPRSLQTPRVSPCNAAETLQHAKWYVENFEGELKCVTGAKHAVALSSGTAALHMALVAAGVGPGQEVLCPSLTFAATANAIVHAGAIPHFVDVNHSTLGIHPFKLRQYLGDRAFFAPADGGWYNIQTGRPLKAIVPVHLLGVPCDVREILPTADYYGLTVIEDAAEALGSRIFTGEYCGTVGKAGILSFNLNKIATTGGGGAVLTDDEAIAQRIRHLTNQAGVKHPFFWSHDAVGWNYKMPPPCASIGIQQLTRLKDTLRAKRNLWSRYVIEMGELDFVTMQAHSGQNDWLNYVLLDPRLIKRNDQYGARDDILGALVAEGYGARALFTPLHMLPHFNHCPRQPSLETSEDLFRRCVCLPSTVGGSNELF